MGFGGLGAQVSRDGVDAVRFFIEFHSASSAFGLDIVDHGVLVWRILMNHRQCPVAVRAEEQLRAWIETGSVHALANSWGCHHPARVGVHDHHHPVVASNEEPPVPEVNCHSRWAFPRCKGPAVQDLEGLRIDLDHFVLVLEIIVDVPLAVCRSKLRAAAKIDRADDTSRSSVDGGSGSVVSVEGEYAL